MKKYDKGIAFEGCMKQSMPGIYMVVLAIFTIFFLIRPFEVDPRDAEELFEFAIFVLVYIIVLYFAVIDSLLDLVDIICDRQVSFKGQYIKSGDFERNINAYRVGLPTQGNQMIVMIDGRKKKMYAYYPLTQYIKRTARSQWCDDIWIGDEIQGTYLKHSKMLIELKVLEQQEV